MGNLIFRNLDVEVVDKIARMGLSTVTSKVFVGEVLLGYIVKGGFIAKQDMNCVLTRTGGELTGM